MSSIDFAVEACRECRSCELVCSLIHERVCAPSLSRIRLLSDVSLKQPEMYVCRHCSSPRCLEACAQGAMSKHAVSGAVVVDSTHCTGCGDCVEACPYNSQRILFLHPETRTALKCDLCGGHPECVRICPNAALAYCAGAGERRE